MNLTPEEADIIYLSLSMRKNLIETGDCMTDKAQAERKKMPFVSLSTDQMKIVIKIEEMMTECLGLM